MTDADAEAPERTATTLPPGESEAWAPELLDATDDAVIVVDGRRRVRGWNRRATLLYGYDPRETVGRDLLELPPFDGSTGLGALVEEQLVAAPPPAPAEFVHGTDGRSVAVRRFGPADARAAEGRSAAAGGVLVMIRDERPEAVTEGDAAAALRGRLERGRALLDTMLRQLATGLVVVEAPSGRLLMHNDEATRLMETTALSSMADAVEKGAGAEHPDGTPYRPSELPLSRALRGETVRREAMVYRRADGTPLHVTSNAAPVRDEDGTILFAVATFDDVSDRNETESVLRASEEELERMNQRLLHDALHDVLTGLPNRTLLLDRLGQVLHRRLENPERDAAVLFLDFDRFKIVNDSLGHAVGDAMLVRIGRILTRVVRPEDTVARLGGDEFVILMDHVDAPEWSADLAERIADAFEGPIEVEEHRIYTGASIGIVPSLAGYDAPHAVLRDADTAMYRAKASGGGGFKVFDQGMRERAVEAMKLETALRQAVRRDEFRTCYGPIHRLDTREVIGFEALVRWEHPEHGLLEADGFLQAATEIGVMRQIDRRVWREASRVLAGWRERFDRRLLLSLNFSDQHFLAPNAEKALLDVLEETGVPFDQVAIEVTAGTVSDMPDDVAKAVLRLVAHGIDVHLDDFGTGQASLVNLQGLHVGALKIDSCLVARMTEDPKCADLVRTIFAMADTLNLDVVAKGVETEAQRERLLELGCTYAQGFLFSAPLDEEGAARLLREEEARDAQASDA